MKILKRNQIIISVIALMLITAGYLSYTTKEDTNTDDFIPTSSVSEDVNLIAGIGDATLVNSNKVVENETKEEQAKEEDAMQTSIQNKEDEYFVSSRLGRDTMYSQMLESYQKILESDNVSPEQKAISQQEITNINNIKNAIMISENLIKTKAIEDVIIFVNDKSISVIIRAEELTEEKIAQVQNIISREMKAEIENIHISNK